MRTFNGIDLDTLEYRKLHGVEGVAPARDLSGVQYELDEKERAERQKTGEAIAEEELASAALTA